MKGKDVLFDIGNKKVGFAESYCDYFDEKPKR